MIRLFYYKSQGTVFSQDSQISNNDFEEITEEEYLNILEELSKTVYEEHPQKETDIDN